MVQRSSIWDTFIGFRVAIIIDLEFVFTENVLQLFYNLLHTDKKLNNLTYYTSLNVHDIYTFEELSSPKLFSYLLFSPNLEWERGPCVYLSCIFMKKSPQQHSLKIRMLFFFGTCYLYLTLLFLTES